MNYVEFIKGLRASLPEARFTKPIFHDTVINEISKFADKYGIEKDLINRLLILTEENRAYSNKSKYRDSIDRLLGEKWLHKDIYDEKYENIMRGT